MGISEACIRRPVMTTLITASLIVFGAFAYRLLSVSALPAVDFPTIAITAPLPGASPDPRAASVAAPIERQLSTIAGIRALTSTSALGITTITVQFDLNRNIDGAALDVQTALTVAARRLPVEMTTPPFFRKVNPGDFPILFISLNSPTLPMSTVDEYGQTVLAQQISQLPGVAQVLVYGGQKVCRARPGRSGCGGRAQHLARRHPHRAGEDQFEHACRHDRGRAPEHHALGLCGNQQGGGLQEGHRRLSQRRAGEARRNCQRRRRRREQSHRELL